MSDLLHKLQHLLGRFAGDVEVWTESCARGDGEALMVGYRCRTCGELTGIHENNCGWMAKRSI